MSRQNPGFHMLEAERKSAVARLAMDITVSHTSFILRRQNEGITYATRCSWLAMLMTLSGMRMRRARPVFCSMASTTTN